MRAAPGVRPMLPRLKQTAVWRAARQVKRSLAPPRHAGPLSAADCRSEVAVLDPPVALEAGRNHPWRVRVQNLGGAAWATDGSNPVRLSARWLTYRGDAFGDPVAVPLPRPVYPGEPREFPVPVPTPDFVGDYVLAVDLEQADGGRFADRTPDSKAVRAAVPVMGRRSTDIDYHEVFRTANLGENHWWVVGAYHSQEQYERSSRERLGMLQKYGLTPDGRVLDIGCGTGQMGDALEGYLSDRGAYYGTDIGREAIAFCREKFRRPNFVFRAGEMTRVPFHAEDGAFDLAIFFSVFTHTFVDESALLLAEARRLLKPDGRVIADVIVSPLVERGAGHRGEMVVNKDHFLRLADMLGMDAEVIGRWPWNPQAERLMLLLRRR